jgi:Zn-finger nucleic acid-binding protein
MMEAVVSAAFCMKGKSVSDAQGLLCPTCRVNLTMAERQGIEIDYCPLCRGVWLDRGELDKIIERSEGASSAAPAPRQQAAPPPPPPQYRDRDHGERGYDDRYYGKPHKKKYKSFLSELFD